MGDYFQFSLVFIKKNITKLNFFLKKSKPNRNRFKPTGFGSFFKTKTGSNLFGSVFSGLTRFFLGFFRFRFGFFDFGFIKSNRLVFFKILIGFSHDSVFSVIVFCFSGFNRFFSFFSHQ
jgi:hypothetical protein